jgi:hypothetical protein
MYIFLNHLVDSDRSSFHFLFSTPFLIFPVGGHPEEFKYWTRVQAVPLLYVACVPLVPYQVPLQFLRCSYRYEFSLTRRDDNSITHKAVFVEVIFIVLLNLPR